MKWASFSFEEKALYIALLGYFLFKITLNLKEYDILKYDYFKLKLCTYSVKNKLYFFLSRPEEHIDVNGSPNPNPKSPDCTAFMDMEFSMHAFEHLEVRTVLGTIK